MTAMALTDEQLEQDQGRASRLGIDRFGRLAGLT
jgi:hypothetical protein